MKINKLHLFGEALRQSVRRNPVEAFLAVCFCGLWISMVWVDDRPIWNLLRYAPVVFLLACIFHAQAKWRVMRWLYYLSPLLLIPCYGMSEALVSLPYFFTLLNIQLLYILSTSGKDDRSFTEGAWRYVKSAGIAFVLSLIIWLTLWVITASISYIFDIWKDDMADLILITQAIAFAFCLPLLFILFKDVYGGKAMHAGKAFRILMDYVLSPALIVYAGILYLYIGKIVITFELPKGQVAYMVTAFVGFLFMLKGCQSFLKKRNYDWFYRWASWITLPTLALCWTGVAYRINEYGFTEPRVYLVAVVSVLTLMSLFFLVRRLSHYTLTAWSAVALFSILTYIPGITAKDIEAWSQTGRTEPMKEAQREEMITIRAQSPVDITGYTQLYLLDSYPEEGNYYQTYRDSLYLYIKDSLVYHNDFSCIFAGQLQKAGLSPTDSIPKEKYTELLRLDLDSVTILFENYNVLRTDSGYDVRYMQPKCYLIR